jgi:hypothetical protein
MNPQLAQGLAILQNILGLEKHNGKQNGQHKQAPFGNAKQSKGGKGNEPLVHRRLVLEDLHGVVFN